MSVIAKRLLINRKDNIQLSEGNGLEFYIKISKITVFAKDLIPFNTRHFSSTIRLGDLSDGAMLTCAVYQKCTTATNPTFPCDMFDCFESENLNSFLTFWRLANQ